MTKSGLFMSAMVAALALGGCNKTPEPPKAETESGAMNDVVTASANPQVGGAVMAPDKTILANAAASPILSQLTAAVNQAGLADTLGAGAFHAVCAQ